MKKYLVLICSMLLVLGAFTFASADDAGMDSVRASAPGAKVILGGDAYVRGIWQQNFDYTSDDDDDVRYYDERIRLKVNAQVDGGAEVRARAVLFGSNNNGAADDVVLDGANTERNEYLVDYAYLHVPIGSVTVDTGLYKRSFGNRLNIWDARVTTLQASMAAGNVNLTAYTDKVEETSGDNVGDDNLKDYDAYGLVVSTSVNDVNIAALLDYRNDARPLAADADPLSTDDGLDDTGYILGLAVNAKVSNIDLAGEFAYEGGDLLEGADEDANYGLFVSGSMPMNQLTVGATVAYAAKGFEADDHFNPTLFIGDDQVTSLMNFAAADDETSWGVAASAAYAVNDDLSVGGKLAYYAFPDQGTGGDDASLTEIDLTAGYKLSANAAYAFNLGYGSVDNLSADDDSPMVIAHEINISF